MENTNIYSKITTTLRVYLFPLLSATCVQFCYCFLQDLCYLWQLFDQYMIYMFCLDVYWTDILEISEIIYVAVIGRFTFLSVFEKSKTAPVSLNSCRPYIGNGTM